MKDTDSKKMLCEITDGGLQVLRVMSESECLSHLKQRNKNNALAADISDMNKILEKHRLNDSKPHSGGERDV